MKKYLLLLCIGMSFSNVQAQETTPDDVIRLAVDNLTGTARFRGMSGAFGAVGGDLSAINVNPAGSIFFNNNFATISGSVYNAKNKSRYFGTSTNDTDSTLDINQAGAIFIFKNGADSKSDWKKIAIGLNYENANNFNNSVLSAGTNPYNSIGNYFVNIAQGIPTSVLNDFSYYDLNFYEQQAYLGYDTYIFEPTNNVPNNNSYYTNIPTGGNYYQENQVFTTGYNGKLSGNFSASYKDIIFLGGNLNFHFVNIEKLSSVYESNDNPLYDTGSTISEILFENRLWTTGSGFSFNLGAIVKPIESVRIGLAYESPTWFRLTDELQQGVRTRSLNNQDGNEFPFSFQDPIVYLPYTVQTPGKWTGSLAYIFGKKGLLSVDVSSKDYSATRIKPKNDPSYMGINNFMNNALDNAIEVRVGGEFKIKQVSLRAGYRFEESPYKVDQAFGDLTGYTGGIGYNFGESRLDLAYSYDHRNSNQAFVSSGMTDPARISRYNNNVTVSYSVNF
ncbi:MULTISPECIES: OmpP1/FadL family transporter [unclassified Flavobacterium]|uniref:OmpP1/FadL family transporter n=1 Tax=unclassified Flavobacterium TaxID=196869 RepID=UPI000EB2DF44|nr:MULTISPECIES: outer membrane protein transport protein [unclassified Flavobacterium]RKS01974.1 outer membrane protein transport protein (OMPP1/FadL/TodX) [Flavobacterium sp. 102]